MKTLLPNGGGNTSDDNTNVFPQHLLLCSTHIGYPEGFWAYHSHFHPFALLCALSAPRELQALKILSFPTGTDFFLSPVVTYIVLFLFCRPSDIPVLSLPLSFPLSLSLILSPSSPPPPPKHTYWNNTVCIIFCLCFFTSCYIINFTLRHWRTQHSIVVNS